MRFNAKANYCKSHSLVGWYTYVSGVDVYIHGFQHGVNDYMIGKIAFGDSSDESRCSYFRRKVYYNRKGEPYVRLVIGRVYLKDCLRARALSEFSPSMKSL